MASGTRPAVRSVEIGTRTFGLLGGVSSRRTCHSGAPPVFVIADSQSGGSTPACSRSKSTTVLAVWPDAARAANIRINRPVIKPALLAADTLHRTHRRSRPHVEEVRDP